jgi:tetratricopeptide (TPR) repeat protein
LLAALLVTVAVVDPIAPFQAAGEALAVLDAERATAGSTEAERWKRLGLAEFRRGLATRAVRAFGEAVRLEPESALLRFNLGSALFESGRVEAAEREYLRAARDDKLATLALVDAALSAQAAGAIERALLHARTAAQRAPDDAKVRALVDELEAARTHALNRRLHERLVAGRAALKERDWPRAIAELRGALEESRAGGAPAADRAELGYALGRALYESGNLPAAEEQFAQAVALAPDEADFRTMLAATKRKRAEEKPARWLVDVRIGAGYDSNVPQSQIVVTTPGTITDPAAFQLTADLDVALRAVGTPRNGLSLEYRFGQLAYLASALDIYSIQEHDLTLLGSWTPHPRVTLDFGADGFVLLSGVLHIGGFQAGATLGPRITLRDTRGWGTELRLKYQHVFKQALDPSYAYLTGDHDDAEALASWHNNRGRVAVGYLFSSERVGSQYVETEDLGIAALPNHHYVIPYSYYANEVTLRGSAELFWKIRGALILRYEHRDYTQDSYVFLNSAVGLMPTYLRRRIDDRYTVDASIKRQLWGPFELQLSYTLVVNRSTIDNTRFPLDYDNKNYLKHLGVIEFSYLY